MEKPSSSSSDISPGTLNELLSGLQRLFKIGQYYPTGHAILDKATVKFMKLLSQVAGENRSVTLYLSNDTIVLEEVELDADQPHIREIVAMFVTLGISSVTIDRQISLEELHDFVRKMSYYRARIQSSRQFTQVDLTNLPHSITVEQKEFLARAESPLSKKNADSTQNLDSFIQSLSKHGLNETEIGQCRTLLETLPQQLNSSDIELSDLPYASWDDVARLMIRTIKGEEVDTEKDLREGQSNINALATILKKLEEETHDQKSREALNLLVSIIKKPLPDTVEDIVEQEAITRRTFPDKPQISIAKIKGFADKHRLNTDILTNLPRSSADNETVSILLQLCHSDQSLPNQIRMQQLFRDTLSKPLTEKSWNMLSQGLHSIAKTGKQARLSSTIRLLTEPLRRSIHSNTLQLFQMIIKLCEPAEQKLFWPYIVNELLVMGSGQDKKVYHNLCQFAARVPNEEMIANLPKLRGLDAFQETRIASDIFVAVSPACFPLFAFLLKTEIERYVGERILGGLRRNPKDWLIRAVVPLLNIGEQQHKLFLYSYLRQAAQKRLSGSLKMIAEKIIVENLSQLPQDKRGEKWVEYTIATLGKLPGEKSIALLKQISGGKKLLFLPDWPAECRAAAEKALATVKGK